MCRLFTEVAKILHESCAKQEKTNESVVGIESLCMKNKAPKKVRRHLLPLALRTKQKLDMLTGILRHSKSLNCDEILRRSVKFWLYASFLCECLNRTMSKRLQKTCPLFKMEVEIQKLAATHGLTQNGTNNVKTSTNSECESSSEIPIFLFMRAVRTTEMPNISCFVQLLEQEGFTQKQIEHQNVAAEVAGRKDHNLLIECMKCLEPHEFILDPVIRGLFIFSSESDFKSCNLFTGGLFYSQDRASCMVSKVLSPPKETVVLETCAAPGSKTAHIASQFLKNTGKLLAIERDEKRFKTLLATVENHKLSNVEPINCDFLSLDRHDPRFADVEYISCDPSCSGSGMIGARSISHSEFTQSRKDLLKKFQCKLLRRTLTSFPRVHTVVYSTCSLFKEENEEVIADVLASVSNWSVAPIKEYYSSSRGIVEDLTDISPHCLRFWPEKDFTNGFFICKLVKQTEI